MDKASETTKLLAATLPHIAFDGWTEAAMRRGAADAHFPAEELPRLFPGGVADLVTAFIQHIDQEMLHAYAALPEPPQKVRQRMTTLIQLRLAAMAPHKEAVRRLSGWFALPFHVSHGARSVSNTADIMWQAAGDNATDFNWYTKRAMLAGVYSTTLLYWLNDESNDMAATHAFLDRRINNVMAIEKAKGKVKAFVGSL